MHFHFKKKTMKKDPPGLGNRANRYRKPTETVVGAVIQIRKTKRTKRKSNEPNQDKPKIKKY